MKKIIIAAIAAALFGCAQAAELPLEMPGCFVQEAGGELLSLLSIAFLGVLFALAIGYMASQLYRRSDWEALVKVELTQTLLGGAMIFITVWLSAFACSISYELAGGNTFEKADAYLFTLTYREVVPAILRFYDLAWRAQELTAWIIGIPSCVTGICFQPFAGYSMVSYNFETIAGLVTPFAASLMMQRIALQFIQQFAFAYLLPIGFILKVVPFTREAGAFLIALALGLYVVFPLTFVFDAKVMADISAQTSPSAYCSLKAGPGDLAGGRVLDSNQALGGGLCETVIAVLGKLLPQAVFLPALNTVITLAFTRTMARIFSRDFMLE